MITLTCIQNIDKHAYSIDELKKKINLSTKLIGQISKIVSLEIVKRKLFIKR